MQTTYERLRAILVEDYPVEAEQVSLGTSLAWLGIDSIGLADLLFTVKNHFLILLPTEPVALPTVGAVVNLIDGLIAAQSGRIEYPRDAAAKALQYA